MEVNMCDNKQKMSVLLVMGIIALGLVWTGGCKNSSAESQSILADLQESQWTSNTTDDAAIIEVFLQGDGVENIILDSIAMKGDKSGVSPLKASSAVLQDKRIRAEFSKNEAMNLLSNPTHGSTHLITIIYTVVDSADSAELDMQVTLDEGEESGALSLEVDPSVWDLNYVHSSGKVETFLRGEGIEKIDLTTIRMKGDNPTAEPLGPESTSLKGEHIRAAFPKNQVLNLLLNPAEGSVHTIVLNFLETGGTVPIELTAQITITDEDGEDEEEPGPLTLQISPSDWNLNYYKNSGTVSAFIRGEGIDKIVLTSIQLKGDNTAAVALVANSAALNGDHVRATFPKNLVLGLLLNPVSGSVHMVTVSFESEGGLQELTAEVTVTGKSE